MFGWFGKKNAQDDLQQLARHAGDIIADYGELLERGLGPLEIRDDSTLPHPKERILSAICLALATKGRGQDIRDELMQCALSLANFQKGVGKHALHPNGVDLSKFDVAAMDGNNLVSLILSNPDGKEKHDRLSPLVRADIQRIGARLQQAESLFKQQI